VLAGPAPLPAAHPEETEQVLRWLEQPNVRLVHLDGTWTCPVHGAAGARERLEPAGAARTPAARAIEAPQPVAVTADRLDPLGAPAAARDRRPA
jgi:DNA polymerase-3 subunit epsilon